MPWCQEQSEARHGYSSLSLNLWPGPLETLEIWGFELTWAWGREFSPSPFAVCSSGKQPENSSTTAGSSASSARQSGTLRECAALWAVSVKVSVSVQPSQVRVAPEKSCMILRESVHHSHTLSLSISFSFLTFACCERRCCSGLTFTFGIVFAPGPGPGPCVFLLVKFC